MWPYLPLKLIMADQYRTIDRIGEVKVPLFIVHGGRDNVIPLDQARHVFHAANEPKSFVVVPRAGHNDLFEQGAWGRVRDFLVSLAPAPAATESVARAGLPVEMAAAADVER